LKRAVKSIQKYSDKEVINAGVAGYTITDEVSLFVERAKYVEPDITILQVLDNNLHDLLYFKRNPLKEINWTGIKEFILHRN